MKKISFLLVILLVILSVNQAHSSAMVTYTFDDGGKSTLDAYNFLNKYNQVGVSGPSIFGTWYAPNLCMSPQELSMLQTGGWEISSHTISHPQLVQIPYRYENELLSGWSLVSGKIKTYQTSLNYNVLPFILQDGDIMKSFNNGGNLLYSIRL